MLRKLQSDGAGKIAVLGVSWFLELYHDVEGIRRDLLYPFGKD